MKKDLTIPKLMQISCSRIAQKYLCLIASFSDQGEIPASRKFVFSGALLRLYEKDSKGLWDCGSLCRT